MCGRMKNSVNKSATIDRYFFEQTLWSEEYKRVMGLDEVGRGCLCGPVVAGGVILKPGSKLPIDVRDSKTLSLTTREEMAEIIKEESVFWTVQSCSPNEIDKLNILQASIKAMLKCTVETEANPDFLLVDGNRFTAGPIPHKCIIKGDNKSASIAAASILAKVKRDLLMKDLHQEYPYFGWDSNVGYPTKMHFEGLQKHGYTKYHRRSFRLRTDKKIS